MMIGLTVSTVMIAWRCIEFVLVFSLSYRTFCTYKIEMIMNFEHYLISSFFLVREAVRGHLCII